MIEMQEETEISELEVRQIPDYWRTKSQPLTLSYPGGGGG